MNTKDPKKMHCQWRDKDKMEKAEEKPAILFVIINSYFYE